jgi:transcriptional regulator with XRE-family HTH domain
MTMSDEGAAIVAEGFGQNLRRIRRREDLSQEQLGRRASLHRTEIGLLERGGRAYRIDTLIRVAGALEVRPEELLEGIAWIPGPETRGTFTHSPRQSIPPKEGSQPEDEQAEGSQSKSKPGEAGK